MKIVVAHNFYASTTPSGENLAVLGDVAMLERAGVQVVPFFRHSDEIQGMSVSAKAFAAAGPVVEPRSMIRLADTLRAEKPDALHLHNAYPLISPASIRVAHVFGIPTVQTIHNYRFSCVAGTHWRDGALCELCTGRIAPWPAVRHGCYRGSRLQSSAMVAGSMAHRNTWSKVSVFLALTRFMAARLEAFGINRERISIRPTSADGPKETTPVSRNLLFLGRFDDYKGVTELLSAWGTSNLRQRGWTLRFAGSGVLEPMIRSVVSRDPSVSLLGQLAGSAVRQAIDASGALAVPSQLYEGYPLVVAEAFAHGRPVIANRIGSLGTIVPDDCGWTVNPGIDSWRLALDRLSLEEVGKRGAAARAHWAAELSPQASSDQLLRAYRRAIESQAA